MKPLPPLNRRHFLPTSAAALAGACLTSPARAAAPPLTSFFVIGDTHFLAEKTQPERMDPTSAAYTARLVDTLNRLPGTEFSESVGGGKVPAPSGVLHGEKVMLCGEALLKAGAMVKGDAQASTSRITWPSTLVNRRCTPLCSKVRRSWSRPRRWRMVALKS